MTTVHKINYQEHLSDATTKATVAFLLHRETLVASKVATVQMFKQVAFQALVDPKLFEPEFECFYIEIDKDAHFAGTLYKDIISRRDIPITMNQPKERFISQAIRIFSSILDSAGRENIPKNKQIEMVLAKTHYEIEKRKEQVSIEHTNSPPSRFRSN